LLLALESPHQGTGVQYSRGMARIERNTVDWHRRRAAVLAGVSHRDLLALALHLTSGQSPWGLAEELDRGVWRSYEATAAAALYPARVSVQPVAGDAPDEPALF